MINTDYEDTLDAYEAAADLSAILIAEVSSFYQLDSEELRWRDFVSYAKDQYNVIFRPFQFNSAAKRILSGSLLLTDYGAAIGFNADMPFTRRHFTITHELAHYFKALKTKIMRNQSYSDLLENRGYTEEEEPDEVEANFTSAMLLVPDAALANAIKSRWSFGHMLFKFEISSQALYHRLVDHLIFVTKLPANVAVHAVRQFENDDDLYVYDLFFKKYYEDSRPNPYYFNF